jgi:hypothetical protein
MSANKMYKEIDHQRHRFSRAAAMAIAAVQFGTANNHGEVT